MPLAPSPHRCESSGFAPHRCRHARQCRDVIELVAAAFHVPLAELTAPTRRTAAVAAARQTAMYLARVTLGLSYRDVAAGFGRDARTVVHACCRIEDRRDDPRVDAVMTSLETACGGLALSSPGYKP
jgi:chromosomal replication initiation ATPase DnaA